MLKGNKGEWSEVYTLLKVLSDKVLFAGNENLEKVENLVFPVIKILRDESNGTFEFSYDNDIVVIKGDNEEIRIAITEFHAKTEILLRELKNASKASFSIPEIEEFISSFNCKSLKASSSVKSDIKIVIHDHRTGADSQLGFSIKSQLGGASTLLNAGRTTNFVYRINNLSLNDNEILEINTIEGRSKIKDRIERIENLGGDFEFLQAENSIFESNLTLIDSALPEILSRIIFNFFTSRTSKVSNLVDEIARINPINYSQENNHPFYSYKIKKFLTDVALGMMPSKVWSGEYDATGGYLLVKDNGDVLCYHIYNRNEFESYLLHNTKLETASSKRHGFGSIFTEEGELKFKLNLQVRFLK